MRASRFAPLLTLLVGSWVGCGGNGTTPQQTVGGTTGPAGTTGTAATTGAGGAGGATTASTTATTATTTGTTGAGGAGGSSGVGGGGLETDLCGKKVLVPWSRKSVPVGGALSFNEVMYHPAGDPQLEWIELHSSVGIDLDLSDFRLAGAISYTFPQGTFLPGRGLLVIAANAPLLNQSLGSAVASGSYTGLLPNGGGTIELWNNSGRLLDSMTYGDDEPWAVAPDGSGASLAKIAPGSMSSLAESWTSSGKLGGTPGAPNFADGAAALAPVTLVPPGASWRYQATGVAPVGDWTAKAYDDSSWPSAPATFYSTSAAGGSVGVTATFTADNFFALYAGKADGSNLTLIGRDSVGDWTSAEAFPFQAGPEDHLFVAAWEAPGDDGGPQSLIGEVALPGGLTLPTSPQTFEWILGPVGASPGGGLNDPTPAPATLLGLITAADAAQSWASPQISADKTAGPWGGALNGVFTDGTQFIWSDTFDAVSNTNTANTYALFRSRGPILPAKGTTKVPLGPTTTYYRTHFQVPADLSLVQPWLDALVDDGAVFYLNGAEVLRLRMPNGAVTAATFASSSVVDAILSPSNLVAANALLPGDNVLSAEVHQAMANDPDMTFGATFASTVAPISPGGPPPGLAFNEIAGASPGAFWLELANRGTVALDVGGYLVASSNGAEVALAPQVLAPGEVLKLDQQGLGFGGGLGDRVFLYTPDHGAVLDGAVITNVPRGRDVDDPAWRYPDTATPGAPNVFTTHHDVVISEIMYGPPPEMGPNGLPAKSTLEWIELFNRSNAPVDVSGYQLVDAVGYAIPAGVVIQPGGYLVVARSVAAMKAAYPSLANAGPDQLVGDFKGSLADSGDNVVLKDACGNSVDGVHYRGDGRWPEVANGGGSSLELRDPRADHGAAEAWAASDEASGSAWETITYQGVAQPSSVGPDGQWQELLIGLLDAGVVLIDDVSVTKVPGGAQLIQNGSFESGTAAGWRLLGNHRHSEVVVDPTDAGNHVLRVVATGATEHMHNHLETTLAAGQSIQNGQTYQISLRAKWEGGSNQLNTRLYFDRLARTTRVTIPALHGTPGAPNSRAVPNIGPTYRELHHSPAVPLPGQPVLVSVVAADPDGIGTLDLKVSVDGAAETSLPMVKGDGGRYSVLVPGGASGQVIQFYVSGIDGLGAGAMFPARGPASRALFKVDDGKASTQGLHNVRIAMTPGDVSWVFDPKNVMSNDQVGATIIDDEEVVYYDVGVRLKGSERGRPEVVRVGFAFNFSAEQPFRGIYRDLMVDRSEGVNFGQRELFFNQAMNHAGFVVSHHDDLVKILSPKPEHVGPAQLQLTRFGDLLLDYQFENGGDGAQFEYELIYFPVTTDSGTPQGYKLPQPDGVVGTSIHNLGNDPEAYRMPFILKNNRWKDDYQGLIAFAKVFGTSGPVFDAQVGSVVDVDQFLRGFAFGTLSGVVDNYAVGDQHNGNFYIRPSDGKALYFPHDLDFWGGNPQAPLVASGDLAKLIGTPERNRAYYGHLYDIVTTSYNPTYLAHWANHLGALLPGQDFAGHLAFVAARSDWVLNGAPDAVLKAIPKVVFKITTNGGAPFVVATDTVSLTGTGWVDVSEVRAGNPSVAIPLTWPAKTTWQGSVPLSCGANAITLDAFDRHGAVVGSSAITVTRSGGVCP